MKILLCDNTWQLQGNNSNGPPHQVERNYIYMCMHFCIVWLKHNFLWFLELFAVPPCSLWGCSIVLLVANATTTVGIVPSRLAFRCIYYVTVLLFCHLEHKSLVTVPRCFPYLSRSINPQDLFLLHRMNSNTTFKSVPTLFLQGREES